MRQILRNTAALILAAIGAVSGLGQGNQTFQQRWYFASDFNYSIKSQTANTYQWSPGTVCFVPPTGSAGAGFNAFNTNAPTMIADNNPALNEVLTPSAVTISASFCNITLAALNQHYSFQMVSGTGGLQEALNQVSPSAVYPAVIFLDRNWYSSANQIPTTTPAGIIASVAGNTNVYLIDNTSDPWAYYTWNGTKYVATAGNTGGDVQAVVAAVLAGSGSNGAVLSGTYTSGITATGSTGQTCTLTSFNDSSTATATVALTSTNTIAGSTALVITSPGTGATAAPTSATAGSGTATCSGTATISTVLAPVATIATYGAGSTQLVNLTTGSVAPTTGNVFTLKYNNLTGGVISGTYTSGLTVTGAKGTQVCLTASNNSSTATALLTLTSANTIAGSTALQIVSPGTGATAAPTTATVATTGCGITAPATTASGTATISTTLGSSGAFAYNPSCTITSVGANVPTTALTISSSYSAPTVTATAAVATNALSTSTAYQWRVNCQ